MMSDFSIVYCHVDLFFHWLSFVLLKLLKPINALARMEENQKKGDRGMSLNEKTVE